MLILTRRKDEEIDIGEGIKVKVMSIHGSRIKLGVVAPEGVRIMRTELAERLAAEKDAVA